MKSTPLVSIALCTYNGERFLRQQLETLVNQTYLNIEIIVVDDCSSDDTFQLLLDYAARYPQFRIYKNEQNLGFLSNFERALSYCNGQFIALCDQDDLWDIKKIASQVDAIGDNLLLYHDSEFINERGESLKTKMSDLFNFYRGDDPEAFLFFNCVSGHTMLIKKELIKEALPFKKGTYHDWWMAYIATNIGAIDYIPQCLVKYRQHDNSDTDLLDRKDAEKDIYRHETTLQLFKRRLKWLQHCANYPKNKRPEFVDTLLQLYAERPGKYISVKLAVFLERNIDILYFISKLSTYKKYREVVKLTWGYKTKNIWYTYIKPNKNKIFRADQ